MTSADGGSTGVAYCVRCGSAIDPAALYCGACGAAQAAAAARAEAGGSEGRREQIERISPGAEDFVGALATYARNPGFLRAVISAAVGVGVMFVAGVLLAVLMPDKSLITFGGMGVVDEVFFQTLAFTAAGFTISGVDIAIRITPAIFLAFPLLGTGVPAFMLARRATDGATPIGQVAWGVATAIPFALLMLVLALAVGEISVDDGAIEPSIAGVFLLSLLWGAIGGGVGATLALSPEQRTGLLPERLRPAVPFVAGPLRALLLALALTAAIGTAAVIVQTIRDSGHVRETLEGGSKSAVLGTVDSALYAVEHGMHWNQLGAAVAFEEPLVELALGFPLPVADYQALMGAEPDLEDVEDFTDIDPGTYRIFDYRHALPGWAFIPFLGLLLIPALFAAYGGFAIARTARTRSPGIAAAWGALVGPIWCIAMLLLTALVDKDVGTAGIFGAVDGDSVFVMYLLGGAAFGAIGALIAGQAGPSVATPVTPGAPAHGQPPPAPPPRSVS